MNQNDARVRYTKEVIRKAFLELLREKNVARITVKELCEKSGINRATFYKHYADVYDLMEQIESALLDEEKQMLQSMKLSSMEDMYRATLQELRNHKDEWNSLFGWNGDPHLLYRQMELIRTFSFPLLARKFPDLSKEKQELVYSYLLQGSGSIIYSWMKDETLPLEETVELLSALTSGVCQAAFRLSEQEGQKK